MIGLKCQKKADSESFKKDKNRALAFMVSGG